MAGRLHGKAGLVTGAASGIGRACALRLAQDGGRVVVADLETARERGLETVALIEQGGGTAAFVPCDVRRPEDHALLVRTVVESYGALDFACNNAGIGVHGRIADTSIEDFDRVIAVNLRGTFLGLRAQLEAMLRGDGGAIVNIASNAGLRGVRGIGAYTASKHGIVGLTKNAALEYAEEGIRVNAVCPGAIATALTHALPEERQREIMAPQALQRLGEPSEVAAAVAWLCSEDASFVTGVALPVDAGSVAGW